MHAPTLLLPLLALLAPALAAEDPCHGGFGVASNPGDTCESFAKQWRITVDELKRLNPGITCPELEYRDDTYCVKEGTMTGEVPDKKTTDLSDNASSTAVEVVTTSSEASASASETPASSRAEGAEQSSATAASSSAASGAASAASSGAAPTGSSGAEALSAGGLGLVGGAVGVFFALL